MFTLLNLFHIFSLFNLLQCAPDVTVQDLRLFFGSDEYYVKGICYSPSPIAQDDNTADVGYCTDHTYFVIGQHGPTEQKSPCFYQDYFDGSSYSTGPANGYAAVWNRDFPILQSAGVNTLRIYHAFPVTSTNVAASTLYDPSVVAPNHIPFMDLADSYGFKVIFPLWSDETYVDNLSADYMQEYIRNIVDEVGNHPALLMYEFGNELQFSANGADYVQKIANYINYARAYQLQKWGRKVPLTTALIDNPNYYNQLVTLPVDVVTANAGYRGFDFSDLWTGNAAEHFSGFTNLSCSQGKPLLIGEMGVHHNTPVFDVPNWFPEMWGDLLNHKTSGAVGGFLFEYSDEGWKGTTDGTMGLVTPEPTGPWAVGQFYLDTVTTKSGGAYDWNSISSTFAINPFGQSGPATLSSVSNNYCPAGSPSTPLGIDNTVPTSSASSTSSTSGITNAPTTKVPTTPAPTTKSPTTKAPTTKAPTTKAPTTKPPTTTVPSASTTAAKATSTSSTHSVAASTSTVKATSTSTTHSVAASTSTANAASTSTAHAKAISTSTTHSVAASTSTAKAASTSTTHSLAVSTSTAKASTAAAASTSKA